MKSTSIGKIADVQTGPFGSQLHKDDYILNGTPIVTGLRRCRMPRN